MEPTTTGVATGTTIGILALYLEHKLTIMAPTDEGMWPCLVVALNALNQKVEYRPLFEDGRTGASFQTDCGRVLPRLKNVAALTQQLPDGTVPAVEVAKLAFDLANKPEASRVFDDAIAKIQPSGGVFARVTNWVGCLITPSWQIQWHGVDITQAHNLLIIYDYLRSQKFALPINGKPLVEGIDFIPL